MPRIGIRRFGTGEGGNFGESQKRKVETGAESVTLENLGGWLDVGCCVPKLFAVIVFQTKMLHNFLNHLGRNRFISRAKFHWVQRPSCPGHRATLLTKQVDPPGTRSEVDVYAN